MGKVKTENYEKQGLMMRFLNGVERVGNKMPDPVTIFVILWFVVLILSAIVANSGATAIHPGQIDEETGKNLVVKGVNLLSKEQLQLFFGNVVTNFTSFAPLGLVLVTMLGAGLAEKSGYMETVMKSSVTKVPKGLLTGSIIFIGIMANAVADAGFVVLPPLAALVFLGVGRHPLVGLFAGYAGVAGGFSANLLVSMIDVLLAGFTTPAAQIIDPNYVGTPAMNWYFLMASTVILTVLGAFITEKYLAPRFEGSSYTIEDGNTTTEITDQEKKA
ncbi:MAG: AbgT family transporter, partial [Turicibacter sp.]|nr:AbgT family transporter [Turicibacter sp.]